MPPRTGCPADQMQALRSKTWAWLVALVVLPLVLAAGFVGL